MPHRSVQYSQMQSGWRDKEDLLGAIVAKREDGVLLASARTRILGSRNTLVTITKFREDYPEVAQNVFDIASGMSQLMGDGLVHVGTGQEYALERRLARSSGFEEQTYSLLIRFNLAGYDSVASGSLLQNPFQGMLSCRRVLDLWAAGVTAIEMLDQPFIRRCLEILAAEGVGLPDRPPPNRPRV